MKYLVTLALLVLSCSANAAVCYVSEYESMVIDDSGRIVHVPQEPAITVQAINHTTTTQSAAFNADTRFVGIVCDEASYFEFGPNPTSTTADPYIPANVRWFFGIARGAALEVSFCDADCS